MDRWLIFRPEFYPCLCLAIRREGPFGIVAIILFVTCLATAIGLTIDCLVDLFKTGSEPFYEVIATAVLYVLCGAIFVLFGKILLKTIRDEIAEIDRLRRAPRQAVFYRRIPNEEESDGSASASSATLSIPSGYVSAEHGAVSDESRSLSSVSTAAASGSATSGYTSAEPEIEAAEFSGPPLESVQGIESFLRASRRNLPIGDMSELIAEFFRYMPLQTDSDCPQPRIIPRTFMPTIYAPYLRRRNEDFDFRADLESIKDSAVYVYEELEMKRSQSNPEDFVEICSSEEEGFKSLEEMQVRLVRRPIRSTIEEQQPGTSSENVEDEAHRTNSGN